MAQSRAASLRAPDASHICNKEYKKLPGVGSAQAAGSGGAGQRRSTKEHDLGAPRSAAKKQPPAKIAAAPKEAPTATVAATRGAGEEKPQAQPESALEHFRMKQGSMRHGLQWAVKHALQDTQAAQGEFKALVEGMDTEKAVLQGRLTEVAPKPQPSPCVQGYRLSCYCWEAQMHICFLLSVLSVCSSSFSH